MKILKSLVRACSPVATVLLLSAMLFACAGGSKPSTFYMLRSMESPQESLYSADAKAVSVLLGPITMPAYLDRNQMVSVTGKNEVALDEFNRWAESLRDSFYRVLLEDLSLLLKTPDIYAYDNSGSKNLDYQVTIDVTRFDCAPEGDAVLTVFWDVRGKDDSRPKINRKSIFREPVSSTGTGFSDMVDAQNETLTAFSREIASAIAALKR